MVRCGLKIGGSNWFSVLRQIFRSLASSASWMAVDICWLAGSEIRLCLATRSSVVVGVTSSTFLFSCEGLLDFGTALAGLPSIYYHPSYKPDFLLSLVRLDGWPLVRH